MSLHCSASLTVLYTQDFIFFSNLVGIIFHYAFICISLITRQAEYSCSSLGDYQHPLSVNCLSMYFIIFIMSFWPFHSFNLYFIYSDTNHWTSLKCGLSYNLIYRHTNILSANIVEFMNIIFYGLHLLCPVQFFPTVR